MLMCKGVGLVSMLVGGANIDITLQYKLTPLYPCTVGMWVLLLSLVIDVDISTVYAPETWTSLTLLNTH